MGDPIHFMFGSRVGFSGTAHRTALFSLRFEQIQDGGHLNGPILRNTVTQLTKINGANAVSFVLLKVKNAESVRPNC